MRWLVRLRGDDERHVADLEEGEDQAAAGQDGMTLCGQAGRLTPERPFSRDEMAAAAMGVCARCVSGVR